MVIVCHCPPSMFALYPLPLLITPIGSEAKKISEQSQHFFQIHRGQLGCEYPARQIADRKIDCEGYHADPGERRPPAGEKEALALSLNFVDFRLRQIDFHSRLKQCPLRFRIPPTHGIRCCLDYFAYAAERCRSSLACLFLQYFCQESHYHSTIPADRTAALNASDNGAHSSICRSRRLPQKTCSFPQGLPASSSSSAPLTLLGTGMRRKYRLYSGRGRIKS